MHERKLLVGLDNFRRVTLVPNASFRKREMVSSESESFSQARMLSVFFSELMKVSDAKGKRRDMYGKYYVEGREIIGKCWWNNYLGQLYLSISEKMHNGRIAPDDVFASALGRFRQETDPRRLKSLSSVVWCAVAAKRELAGGAVRGYAKLFSSESDPAILRIIRNRGIKHILRISAGAIPEKDTELANKAYSARLSAEKNPEVLEIIRLGVRDLEKFEKARRQRAGQGE